MIRNEPDLFEVQSTLATERAREAQRVTELSQWMHNVSGAGWKWFVKVLRGNDTLLNNSNQAGPYVSRRIIFDLFPSFEAHDRENVSSTIRARIDSHGLEHDLNVRWWGLKKREAHLTGWGGQKSPVLDPEATGSIIVMAFRQQDRRDSEACRIWLCSSIEEEDAVQERVGPVEPGILLLYDASGAGLTISGPKPADSPCTLSSDELPPDWLLDFPSAAEITAVSVARLPTAMKQPPDDRLVRRRDCEYELFRSIEQMVVLPRIRDGFATVDLFVDFANSVTNRRKSRSGASLGLHASTIFNEEHLPHSYDKISEGSKRPDFLFPSAEAYQNPDVPVDRLTVLAAKTTCKDRWRQILNEADRLPVKHLLTLQEGISPNQFDEMRKARVRLVVPAKLHRAYHESIQAELLTLSQFIVETKARF
jgi:hypothetical protein